MNRFNDIKETTAYNAAHLTYGTVSSSHQHDVQSQYSVYMTVANDSPTTNIFTTAGMTTVGDFINMVAHGYQTGLLGTLTSTGGLPSDFPTAGTYFIINRTVDTIQLADSLAHAIAGTAIDITAKDGTGNHSFKPTALAGLGIHLEASIDGTNWFPMASSTLTGVGSTLMSYTGVSYNYVRSNCTMASGQLTATVKIRSLGAP